MQVVAALSSYACIHVFLTTRLLACAERSGAWLVISLVPAEGAFRVPAARTHSRWCLDPEALRWAAVAVLLGLGGLWLAAWVIELARQWVAFGHTHLEVGAGLAVASACLMLAIAALALQLLRRSPGTVERATTMGLLAVIVGFAHVVAAILMGLHRTPGWPAYHWPADLWWTAHLPWLIGLVEVAAGVALIRAARTLEETSALDDWRPESDR